MPNYKTIADYFVDRQARDLAGQTRQVVCPKLGIKEPESRWIVKDEFGSKWFAENINGWCAKDGRTIYIRRELSPFEIVNTTIHECRHCWQVQHPKRYPIPGKTYTRTMNREQAERDCQIFELEFWNGQEKRDGSFADIERILTDMQIKSARALIQARSLAVQRFIDPNNSRQLFPPGIEFSYPCSTLKLSYQK